MLWLSGCASQSVPENPETQSESQEFLAEIERELQSPTLKSQALRFHQFVQGELGSQASLLLLKNCSQLAANPFCYSIRLSHRWTTYRRKRIIPPKPFEPKVTPPLRLQFEDGKLTNWKSLQQSEKQSLIKAFESVSRDTLRMVGQRALSEKKCPNQIAVAVAANLEDNFPDSSLIDEASSLYEHAARCMREPSDRENFLVRAALFRIWRKEYPRAISILKRVNPSDAFAGRALYWLYRLYGETSDRLRAQSTYHRLRKHYPFSFHAVVAAAENVEDVLPSIVRPSQSSTLMKRSRSSKHINRVMTQIEILNSFNFRESSAVLIDWLLDTHPRMPSKLRLYLTELGDFKIKVSSLPNLFIRNPSLVSKAALLMAYPRAHGELFERYSGVIDPFLLMAIAQKESKFDALAQSPTNARGLMQLLPETAARLAGKSTVDLFDPETNIRLGARYVEELHKRWNERGFLILANYNAGESPLESWLRRFTIDDPLLFIDLIPYRETRDYIGFVLTNYYWYRRLYRGQLVTKVVAPEIARR